MKLPKINLFFKHLYLTRSTSKQDRIPGNDKDFCSNSVQIFYESRIQTKRHRKIKVCILFQFQKIVIKSMKMVLNLVIKTYQKAYKCGFSQLDVKYNEYNIVNNKRDWN